MDANEWWHGEGGEEEQPWEADPVCEEPQCKDGGLAELDAQDRTDPKDSKESASVGMPWKEDTWDWGYDDTWVEQDRNDSAMEPVVVPTEPNAETHMEPERADPSWDQNATWEHGDAWAESIDSKDSAMEPVVVPTEPNTETHMEPERADPSWDQNAAWEDGEIWVDSDESAAEPTEPNAETHMEPERAEPSWDQNATGDNAWANSTWVSCKADSTWGQDSWGQDSWGQDSWGQDAWGQDSWGQDSWGQDSWGQDSWGQDARGQDSWDAGKHDASYDKADKEITEAEDAKDKVKPPVVLRRYSSKGPPSAGLTNTEKESPIKWGPIKNAKLALGLFCVQGVEDQPDDVGTLQVKWWDDDIINKLPELTLADHIRFVKSNFSKFEQVKNWQPAGLSQDLFATLLDISGLVFKQGVQDPAQIVRRFCCCMFSSLRH